MQWDKLLQNLSFLLFLDQLWKADAKRNFGTGDKICKSHRNLWRGMLQKMLTRFLNSACARKVVFALHTQLITPCYQKLLRK